MTAATARRSASALRSSSDKAASSLSTQASFSKTSKTLSSADTFVDIVPEELSHERLEEALASLEKANLMLQLENEVFQDKLSRENPDLLAGLSAILEEEAASASKRPSASYVPGAQGGDSGVLATPSPTTLSPSQDAADAADAALSGPAGTLSTQGPAARASASRMASRMASRTASTAGSLDRAPRMSFGQRTEVAEEAARLATQRARCLRTEGAAAAADLRAFIEEAGTRLAETRAARAALEDGVAGSGDPVSGRASAEKFQRFIGDLVRQHEAAVERTRLKTSALRAHHRRVRADVAVKRELGEALRPVDFEKIRIEIEEYNRKLESKNRHLVDLKNISGTATTRLLAAKQRLADLARQLHSVGREAAAKRVRIAALEREEHKVLEDVSKADVALNAIRTRMERYEAPDVLEYVRLKQQLHVLAKDCAAWERRCNTQRQTARDLRRAKMQQLSGRDGGDSEVAHASDKSSDRVLGPARGPASARTADATDASARASARTGTARRRRPLRTRGRSRSRSRSRSSSGSSSTRRSESSPSLSSSQSGQGAAHGAATSQPR